MALKLSQLLVVDDDKAFLASLERVLRHDFNIQAASDLSEARTAFSHEPDIVLLDIRLDENEPQNKDGVELLKEFVENQPGLPVIMISAYGDIETAVECMRIGAVDFIKKPLDINELRQRLKRAIEQSKLSQKAAQLEERLLKFEPTELIGESPQIQQVKNLIQMVAKDGYVTVLISGETGTGKELVARAIHRVGWRSKETFVPVAIASLNPNLIESELFGHEAGAFTGAKSRRIGFIEKAKGGVLFLDEIGDLPGEVQLKLLRFLEEKKFSRVGSSDSIEMEVQIVTATNRNLEEAVRNGQIRQDLYFRLKSIQILLPPLRDRTEDIPLLANHFLKIFKEQGRTRITQVSDGALEALTKYTWPGNVRELRASLERAIIYANSNGHQKIEKDDLPLEILGPAGQKMATSISLYLSEDGIDLDQELAKWDLRYIEEALRSTEGRKTEAWKLLGLNDRFALHRRVKSILKRYPHLISDFPIIQSRYSKGLHNKTI
jgi:DNA-binding NtrC family response regulator